ncbi:type IV toxin-antitoxin system AbiEi family antitoxin domain-containing protein [Luteimicrobium sp. DT211]|uniref:type IV toxin-antitoxin system AbiEi family antitoxin domain-containing protein n=1 Tax=Luteimicrobium sp. DT211 TaxID=3393412 RepID=UPI003CF0CD1D
MALPTVLVDARPGVEPPLTLMVPPELEHVAGTQVGLVSTEQARSVGVTDRKIETLVRRGRWRRLTRGVLDTRCGSLSAVHWDARRRRAAWAGLLAYGPDAVAIGTCALALLDSGGLPPTIAPQVALPKASNRLSRDGMSARQFDAGMQTVMVDGRSVASAEWAVAQAVPELSRRGGLAVLDSVLHRGLLTPSGLACAHDLARGRRGVAVAHELWELADGRAESVPESYGRLDCIDGGVPPDVLQLPLDDSPFPERGDLGWELGDGRWLVAEVDGKEIHDVPEAAFADRSRQNGLVSTGKFSVLRFTSADLDGVMARTVRRALRVLRSPRGRR